MPSPTIEKSRREPPPVPDACNVPLSGPVDLKGRVAIVTGAGSGIGQAACLALARVGASVALGDVVPCAETIEGLNGLGARHVQVKTDVTREEDCSALVRAALEAFGRVDVLVTSAGVLDLTPIEK